MPRPIDPKWIARFIDGHDDDKVTSMLSAVRHWHFADSDFAAFHRSFVGPPKPRNRLDPKIPISHVREWRKNELACWRAAHEHFKAARAADTSARFDRELCRAFENWVSARSLRSTRIRNACFAEAGAKWSPRGLANVRAAAAERAG